MFPPLPLCNGLTTSWRSRPVLYTRSAESFTTRGELTTLRRSRPVLYTRSAESFTIRVSWRLVRRSRPVLFTRYTESFILLDKLTTSRRSRPERPYRKTTSTHIADYVYVMRCKCKPGLITCWEGTSEWNLCRLILWKNSSIQETHKK